MEAIGDFVMWTVGELRCKDIGGLCYVWVVRDLCYEGPLEVFVIGGIGDVRQVGPWRS